MIRTFTSSSADSRDALRRWRRGATRRARTAKLAAATALAALIVAVAAPALAQAPAAPAPATPAAPAAPGGETLERLYELEFIKDICAIPLTGDGAARLGAAIASAGANDRAAAAALRERKRRELDGQRSAFCAANAAGAPQRIAALPAPPGGTGVAASANVGGGNPAVVNAPPPVDMPVANPPTLSAPDGSTPAPRAAVNPQPGAPTGSGAEPGRPGGGAAAPATAPLVPGASESKVVGRAAWSLIVGNTLVGRSADGEIVEYFAADGTTKLKGDDGVEAGRWEMEGERLCTIYDGERDCVRLEVLGREATLTDDAGDALRFTIEAGNSKNM